VLKKYLVNKIKNKKNTKMEKKSVLIEHFLWK
jgi:hypothetical protein